MSRSHQQATVDLAAQAKANERHEHMVRAIGIATRRRRSHFYWIDGRKLEFRPIREYLDMMPVWLVLRLARDGDVVGHLPWWARLWEWWTR